MDGEYERTWRSRIDDEAREVQLRFGLTTEGGAPVRFLVQLEYRRDGEWLPVARFDHDRDGPIYRDATISGLHLDIHAPDGSQKRKITDFPPIEATKAMPAAERYLTQYYEELVREFERCL